MNKKTVCITGATSGIGLETAKIFAQNGSNLILLARRKEKLNLLKTELELEYSINVNVFELDVQDKQAVFNCFESISKNFEEINVLVNNAGLALGRSNFDEGDISDWEIMMQTNVNGLMYVTKACLTLMKNAQNGKHIINIGSTAGKEVYLQGNAYCASKHAVDALSKAMRMDLLSHNIKVTALHPGAVETEFSLVRYKGDETKAKQVYEGFKPLTPQDIAAIIHYTTALPSHVCINDLVVTCTQQANSFYINK